MDYVRQYDRNYPMNITDVFMVVIRKVEGIDVLKYFPITRLRHSDMRYSMSLKGPIKLEQFGFSFDSPDISLGDSGSLIVSLSEKGFGILGIVSASKSGEGFALPFPKITDQDILLTQKVVGAYDATPFDVDLEPSSSERGIADHIVGYTSGAVFYGSIPESFRESKTNFRPTLFFETVKPFLKKEYAIPILRSRTIVDGDRTIYIDPFCITAAGLSNISNRVEPSLDMAQVCFNDYIDGIADLPVPAIKSGPLSLFQAINSEKPFNRLNMNTSCGFGMKGKKKEHCKLSKVPNVDGVLEEKYTMNPDTLVKYNEWIYRYSRGIGGRPIFSAHKKDEIKSVEKIAKGKERIFNGSPFFYSVACRKYLMPIIVFLQDNASFFEHCVGVNCMSNQWKDIYDGFSKYDNLLAGDFAGFDIEHLRIFLLMFNNLALYIVDNFLDYTPEDKSLVFRLINDGIFAAILMKNDVFGFSKGFVSGHVITITINCFIASMYMRLAWFTIMLARYRMYAEPVFSFRLKNILYTYGDDHILGTKDENFNFQKIKEALSVYGLVYTTSEKEQTDALFFPMEKITFLKRSFVPCTLRDQEIVLCPLEEDSIWKSLAYTDCETSAERHQLAILLCDANKQFWFFGEQVFEDKKKILKAMSEKYFILMGDEESTMSVKWYTYQQLTDLYFANNLNVFFA